MCGPRRRIIFGKRREVAIKDESDKALVFEDRDDPIGTGYFVLLLTKVCQLGYALHVSGDQGVPIGPQPECC